VAFAHGLAQGRHPTTAGAGKTRLTPNVLTCVISQRRGWRFENSLNDFAVMGSVTSHKNLGPEIPFGALPK
jgi:hypothetical protein